MGENRFLALGRGQRITYWSGFLACDNVKDPHDLAMLAAVREAYDLGAVELMQARADRPMTYNYIAVGTGRMGRKRPYFKPTSVATGKWRQGVGLHGGLSGPGFV